MTKQAERERISRLARAESALNGIGMVHPDGSPVNPLSGRTDLGRIGTDEALWYTDNGAIYCTAHLGVTAAYTGRDISGQKIERVAQADVDEANRLGVVFKCEGCR